MSFPFSLSEIILITLVMFMGSALQGSVGYGSALVATPLLVLIDYRLVPVPFSIASLSLVILMMWRERQAIDFRGLGWSVFGRVFGSALGAFILAQFTSSSFVLIFAIMVLLAVLISISGVRFMPTKGSLLGAGFFSGLMGTVAAIGGPPMALVYQEAQGKRIRSTLAAYFILSILISSLAWASIGMYHGEILILGLFLLPGTIMGFLISTRIVHWIDGKYIRPVVLSVAAISGIYVLVQHFINQF